MSVYQEHKPWFVRKGNSNCREIFNLKSILRNTGLDCETRLCGRRPRPPPTCCCWPRWRPICSREGSRWVEQRWRIENNQSPCCSRQRDETILLVQPFKVTFISWSWWSVQDVLNRCHEKPKYITLEQKKVQSNKKLLTNWWFIDLNLDIRVKVLF